MVHPKVHTISLQCFILNTGTIFSKFHKVLLPVCGIPLPRFGTATFFWIFRIGPAEEKLGWPFLLPFHLVNFPWRKHNVHMGLTLTVRHGSNLIMNSIGVVKVL